MWEILGKGPANSYSFGEHVMLWLPIKEISALACELCDFLIFNVNVKGLIYRRK